MSDGPLAAQQLGHRPLSSMVEAVRLARDEVSQLRRGQVGQDRLLAARRSLLGAMESYAAELTARGLPIPRQMRDDIRLQQNIRRHRDSPTG